MRSYVLLGKKRRQYVCPHKKIHNYNNTYVVACCYFYFVNLIDKINVLYENNYFIILNILHHIKIIHSKSDHILI